MAFSKGDEGLSGRMGGRVYRQVGGETIVSAMPVKVDPNTRGQADARRRLAWAVHLWGDLDEATRERWVRYGLAQGRRPDLVFRGLAAKWMQVHDRVGAPDGPPGSPFAGDGLAVTFSTDGAAVFAASGPNAEGILTELLLQPLERAYRKPKANAYRTRRFVAFAGEPARVEVPPGAWAGAVRFVRADTGQASAVLPLGTVVIEP